MGRKKKEEAAVEENLTTEIPEAEIQASEEAEIKEEVKPKRKRRTKKEMEEARAKEEAEAKAKAEAEAKEEAEAKAEAEAKKVKAEEIPEAEVKEEEVKPKRKRRTKKEMEEARAKAEAEDGAKAETEDIEPEENPSAENAEEARKEEAPKEKPKKKRAKKTAEPEEPENEEKEEGEEVRSIESVCQFVLNVIRKNGGVADYFGVSQILIDNDLGIDNFERVISFLEKNNIELKITDDIEDEEDDLLVDDLEDVEDDEYEPIKQLDLTVPEGVGIDDPVRMYLKEIGQVSLLTAQQEVEYAMQMEDGATASKVLKIRYNEEDEPEQEEEELPIDEFGNPQDDEEKKISEEKIKEFEEKSDEELKKIIRTGETAKNRLAEANLRLVVSIAKRYVGRGMQFLDLIQEGNLGLIKAVEKFDYSKGYKFSTYATWWIRQAITRAIADQARTIRIPVHMVETINKQVRISRQLLQELGREPTPEEIAAQMDVSVDRVRAIQKISQDPVSLETPIGEEEDSHLGDFIQDEDIEQPSEAAARTLLKEQINEELSTLTEREQKVLRLRFGLDDGRARTLEEVGREFQVTRERIRQIEAKAIRKLRQPSRKKKLQDYLD